MLKHQGATHRANEVTAELNKKLTLQPDLKILEIPKEVTITDKRIRLYLLAVLTASHICSTDKKIRTWVLQ